ncbi:DUF5701 family protein [Tessaracoccus sp. SD287]|uniref:DUF5701 family protein n=1 Tax=Tessaracoccus sp. SD287 TaxID=2782008 RepID=UPI001A9777F2
MSGVVEQGEKLIEQGVAGLAGLGADDFRQLVHTAAVAAPGATTPLLVVHPALVAAADLATKLERHGKPGFVVTDMTDLADFTPIDGVVVPEAGLYVIDAVARGDELRDRSPAEALPVITGAGRRPLTVSEGISWLLQEPDQLQQNHCFMTIGSRKRRANGTGWDARTPAIWISGGTGRDGAENTDAPKVGWCWHNNRHSWLGFASCKA